MFRRISTKIGVVFASLFAATMLVISVATFAVVSQRAQQTVAEEMRASGAVFSRLFLQRAEDTYADALFLGKDFGFRSAVTSMDAPTISTALRTMANRLDVTSLLFIDVDGDVLGHVGAPLPTEQIQDQILISDGTSISAQKTGVIFAADTPYIVGAAPVYAPNLIGWVFFGDAITAQTFADLKSLSPLALEAKVLRNASVVSPADTAVRDGLNITLTEPLDSFFSGDKHALHLSYPVADAIRPYQVLIGILLALIVAGCLAVCISSWLLARRLAQPIAALLEAAKRIQVGERAQVAIKSRDELGDLALAFNDMSSEIMRREDDLQAQARMDKETGLPNRFAIEEDISIQGRQGVRVIALAIGMERFSDIRNTLGFDNSAELARLVGERLQSVESVSSIAHLGMGVFAAKIPVADGVSPDTVIAGIREDLEQTFEINGTAIDVMFKFGVSQAGGDTAILQHAVIALENARSQYADVAHFDPETSQLTSDNLSLMGDLMAALEAGHVHVAYQPKYDLRTQQPIGAEALVRWKDPVRGPVFPDVFIPLAEETGRINALTRYVLKEAVEAQRSLWAAGHELAMSVNISGRLIGNANFSAFATSLAATAAGPLCFEITETAVIEDPDKGIAAIKTFVDAGIEISIDDYGSGLSSLSYLKRIPAHELKIDKEFVLKIAESQRDALLVRSTIDLAHSLGLKVTAEGIETAAAASLLAAMGCDIGQGYGLGRPVELEGLLLHLREDSAADQDDQDHASQA